MAGDAWKLVSELRKSDSFLWHDHLGWSGMPQIGIRAHGFKTKLGLATNVEFGVKILQGFNVQSVRGALRELLGGNGKLGRSGEAIITTIVVDNHEIEFYL